MPPISLTVQQADFVRAFTRLIQMPASQMTYATGCVIAQALHNAGYPDAEVYQDAILLNRNSGALRRTACHTASSRPLLVLFDNLIKRALAGEDPRTLIAEIETSLPWPYPFTLT
jgi:hypothetical protein